MDKEEENVNKSLLKELQFKAVNTRSEFFSSDDKKELYKRPKFTVVPAQLPSSPSQCVSENKIADKTEHRLSSSATSPASIGLPAIVTPTRPKYYLAENELVQASSSPTVITPIHQQLLQQHNNHHSTFTGTTNSQKVYPLLLRTGSYMFQEDGGGTKLVADANSIRSLTSIGMGCTDGRKMIVKRVPNSPSELLGFVQPAT
uniref:CSON000664 protein n=1 Tax=Culicoides sonorensis TaxID=179676 RepID=A0A336MKM0_CULSO